MTSSGESASTTRPPSRQALDGGRHPVLPVVGQGQADVGHVLALLAVQGGDLGPVGGVVLQQPPPRPAGGHGAVLGRVADEAEAAPRRSAACS